MNENSLLLATFQVFSSYSYQLRFIEHFHHCRKFSWTTLDSNVRSEYNTKLLNNCRLIILAGSPFFFYVTL